MLSNESEFHEAGAGASAAPIADGAGGAPPAVGDAALSVQGLP